MKNWIVGSVAAAALLTACGGGSENDTEVAVTETSVGGGGVKLPGLSLRTGDAAQAADALTALSLVEGANGRVTFGGVTMDGANASFTDVTMTVPDEEEGDTPIKAASLELVGLEMTDEGPTFSQMTFNDISVDHGEDEEDVDVNVGSLQLTNPSPQLAAWVASLMGAGVPAEFPDSEQVSFDGLSLANLSATGDDEDGNGQAVIQSIELRGMGPETLQAAVLQGFNVSGRDEEEGVDFSFQMDSLKMSGADTKFISALQDADGEDEMAAALAQLSAQNPMEPGYDTVELENLNFDIGGVKFDLPEVKASVTRDDQGRATRNVAAPFTMSFAADPNGAAGAELAGQLQQLGFEELELTAAQDVMMDPDADTITTAASDNYIALKDGFKLSGGGKFSGVSDFYANLGDPEFLEAADANPSAVLGALSSLSLYDLELVFEDQSILEKGFQFAAAMMGEDAESLKGQAQLGVGFLPLMGAQAGIDAEILTELSGALSTFLAEPGTLTLKLDPETPVTAALFEDPTQITKASIGFSATAE
ncbi:MAG: hypothetical protein AAF950_03275 [Pseudomonadota bacterium]